MTAAAVNENDGSGPFEVTHRLVLAIAIPMTLGFLTTPLLGLTDTAVAGRLGSANALACQRCARWARPSSSTASRR